MKPPIDITHYTVGETVTVNQSSIPHAGKGLFALQEFRRNDYITFYDGIVVDRQEALDLREKNLDTHIRSIYFLGDCINGYTGADIKNGHGGASIANDLFKLNNCKLVNADDNRVWLQATRNISTQEELGYSYGTQYWKCHSIL
jgi:hypothetical protein